MGKKKYFDNEKTRFHKFLVFRRKDYVLEGNRIVDLKYFLNRLSEESNHNSLFDCTLKNLVVIDELQEGLISKFVIKCNMCNYTTEIMSSDTKNHNMNLNKCLVNVVTSIGCGYAHLQDILNNLQLPELSERKYKDIQSKVFDEIQDSAIQEMHKAAEEEKAIALAENNVGADGIPEILVVCDGTWPKRSYGKNYSSKSGAAAIIGYKTKKVLYLGIKNKYCIMCEINKKKSGTPKIHRCFKNYDGPSTGMEAAILVEGFKSSEDMYGLRYSKFIGDGDSNVHKKILESFPYRKPVEKIECRNHLLRNFRTKMEELCSRTSNGPLEMRNKIKQNILRMRIAVVKAMRHRKSEDVSLHTKNANLRKDVINIPSHTFGEHQNCKNLRYFCDKDCPDLDNLVPKLKETGLYQKLNVIFDYLSKFSNSLIHDVDSNLVEQFNSVISKYIGGKRVNFTQKRQYEGRCYLAALTYNTKRSSFYNLHKFNYGKSPCSRLTKKYERRRQQAHYRQKLKKKIIIQEMDRKESTTTDKNYGPNCEKPDISPKEYRQRKEDFLLSIKKSKREIEEVEEKTREQYNSPEWLEERRKILTASNFGIICRRKPSTYSGPLVKSLLTNSLIQSSALNWGRDNEAKALDELQNTKKIVIRKCGLFLSEKYSFLGATPDGLIGDSGLVEIKCPWSAKHLTPEEGILQKKITFWRYTNGQYILNTKHKWYYQIQGQLAVTNRNYCLFCIWTPLGIKTETILMDNDFWSEKVYPILEKFYFNCYLPELLDSRLARNMPIKEPEYIIQANQNKTKNKKQ